MARDDRVLPETRVLGVFIVPFLLVAFPLLYFFPNDTGNWWAWGDSSLDDGPHHGRRLHRRRLLLRARRPRHALAPRASRVPADHGVHGLPRRRDDHLLGLVPSRPRGVLALDGAVLHDAGPRP